MNVTTDILRGELERLFELDEMKRLSGELLGYDPEQVGGTGGKGAFARALVDCCAREDSLEALADAMLLASRDRAVQDAVKRVFTADPRLTQTVGGYNWQARRRRARRSTW